MKPTIVQGDLLDQNVDVIVNAWNRNVIPWWLLLPQGVSGAIKKRAGLAPFRELARHGSMKLGSAVLTTAGKLPHQAIIHVAGINLCWFATTYSISESVKSAMKLINEQGYQSAAFPLIGAGSGNRSAQTSMQIMLKTFENIESPAAIRIVQYKR